MNARRHSLRAALLVVGSIAVAAVSGCGSAPEPEQTGHSGAALSAAPPLEPIQPILPIEPIEPIQPPSHGCVKRPGPGVRVTHETPLAVICKYGDCDCPIGTMEVELP